jgi:hypothetical protein
MARHVSGPTIPSASRPLFVWNARTACWVRGPKIPSTPTPRARWTCATWGPVEPTFRSTFTVPWAMARLAGEDWLTSSDTGPEVLAAANCATGASSTAAVAAVEALRRRAMCLRPRYRF